jgi:hypothetical protein
MSTDHQHLRKIAEADLQTIRDWLNSLDGCDFDEIAADGGVTVGMVIQQQAREFAKRTQRALDHLSQAQARIAELEGALRPFARVASILNPALTAIDLSLNQRAIYTMSLESFRRARALLKEKTDV